MGRLEVNLYCTSLLTHPSTYYYSLKFKFYPHEVVSRFSDPQLQVIKKYFEFLNLIELNCDRRHKCRTLLNLLTTWQIRLLSPRSFSFDNMHGPKYTIVVNLS